MGMGYLFGFSCRNLRHSFSKSETQSEAILPSSFSVTSEGLSAILVIRSTAFSPFVSVWSALARRQGPCQKQKGHLECILDGR